MKITDEEKVALDWIDRGCPIKWDEPVTTNDSYIKIKLVADLCRRLVGENESLEKLRAKEAR